MTRTPIFIANWKMNKSVHEVPAFVSEFQKAMSGVGGRFDLVLVPSFTHLPVMAESLKGTEIALGAQNCGPAKSGAFTGEVSPVVLKEMGTQWVLVGHSERRHVFHETDALIFSRLKAAAEAGLEVVLCVGEQLADRKAGKTYEILETQLASLKLPEMTKAVWEKLTIAYEPVWAIGTGENATPEQAGEAHAFLRGTLAKIASAEVASTMRILYGGSVKPDNAEALMAQKDVDGCLVGGASLDPNGFAQLVKHGVESRV